MSIGIWLLVTRSNLEGQAINQYVSLSLDHNYKQVISQDECSFAINDQTSKHQTSIFIGSIQSSNH